MSEKPACNYFCVILLTSKPTADK